VTFYGLADELEGSFLDVGCWEGDDAAEAVRRGADPVVGIDLCVCDSLRDNVREYGFSFVQMDIFSDGFLALPWFDVVLCSGVLYHVMNPMGLLFRLRNVTGGVLVLETLVHRGKDKAMRFHDTFEGDSSVWWTPSAFCLVAMLEEAGFEIVHAMKSHKKPSKLGYGRTIVIAEPGGEVNPQALLPRRAVCMSLHGGERHE